MCLGRRKIHENKSKNSLKIHMKFPNKFPDKFRDEFPDEFPKVFLIDQTFCQGHQLSFPQLGCSVSHREGVRKACFNLFQDVERGQNFLYWRRSHSENFGFRAV